MSTAKFSKSGFMLIELLVVIFIISLLLVSAVIGINNARKNARDTDRISDILLSAKAIDQYISSNRGIMPDITTGNKISCISDLSTTGIDFGAFSTKQWPSDPSPYNKAGTCAANYSQKSYTYWSYDAANPVNNFASNKKYRYVLEVALEKEKPNDESLFKTPFSLGMVASADGDFWPNKANAQRYRYVLTGPYCGSSCP